MAASEGDTCPRCGDDQLRLDDQDGFLLCPTCGFVAEEGLFGGPIGGDAGDVVAAPGAQQGGEEGQAGGDEAQGVPAHSHATGPTAATVDAAKRLRAVASVLQLSNACIEDAISFLHQVRGQRLVTLGAGVHNTVNAQIAGVLLLSARLLKQPLSLAEAASAAQVTKSAAAAQLRKLVAALKVQLPPPSAGLRAHTWRMANTLYKDFGGSQAQQGQGAAGAPMPQGNMLQQPLVKTALMLSDLVGKLNIGESRSTPVLAGGILLLVCEQHTPQQLGLERRPGVADISQLAVCGNKTLKDVRILIVRHLMQMAALLPMGGHITESNLLSYLPLIASLATTMAQCMATQAQASP